MYGLAVKTVVAAALVAGLLVVSIASAGRVTTAPGARSYVRVVISKRGILVGQGSSAARGSWIIFHIENHSASTAKVSFGGRVSQPVAPNHHGSLAVFVLRRGAFPLVASLSRERQFRQTFIVY
jgi:hypothetical protein